MNHLLSQLKTGSGAVPCFFYPAVRKKGLSLPQVLSNGPLQKELLADIGENQPVGAVLRMTELWCEAAAFGMSCTISEHDFPALADPVFTNVDSLALAVMPQVENAVTEPLIEAVRLATPSLDKPLIVGVTGPYTLASVLNGSENFMMACVQQGVAAKDFLGRLSGFLIEYVLAYKASGASAVILAEPSASMISPKMMEKFSNQYVQKIIEATQDDNFSIVYHNCGSVNKHLEVIAKLGADAFHFGGEVDLDLALDLIADDRLVMGNLDPRLFIQNSPEEIEGLTGELMDKYAAYDNWRPSTGCDLSPDASIELIMTFIQRAAAA